MRAWIVGERFEPGGINVIAETPTVEFRPGGFGQGRRSKRRDHALEGRRRAAFGEDRPRLGGEPVQRLTLGRARPVERLPVAAGQERALRGGESVSGIEQQVDLLAMPAGELVDRPDREGRLSQLLHLLRLGSPALLPERARQTRSLAHELGKLFAVETIKLVFEVKWHAQQSCCVRIAPPTAHLAVEVKMAPVD